MDLTGGTIARSSPRGPEPDETGLDSLQFNEEIHRLMAAPTENGSSFTALLELPATQAMELLHSPNSGNSPATRTGDDNLKHSFQSFNGTVTFPSNTALIERAARLSVFAGEHIGNNSPETSSVPSNSSGNLERVKSEPAETESSQPLVSDPGAENQSHNQNQRSAVKRKEREKKAKGSAKKTKSAANDSSEDAEKLPYVHVRARRGQATDSHSLAERARREKINARMKLLQELVPGCNKLGELNSFLKSSWKGTDQKSSTMQISGTALVLDEIINHVQSLQHQVEFLSMRLATVNPRIDFNLDNILAAESGSLMDSNFSSMVMPMMWPEVPVNGNRQQYQQQQWHFDAFHQPVWGREEENHQNFITPENSLLSYDSSTNSATLHSSQLKMEL